MEQQRFATAILFSLLLHAGAVAVVLFFPPSPVPEPPSIGARVVRISFSESRDLSGDPLVSSPPEPQAAGPVQSESSEPDPAEIGRRGEQSTIVEEDESETGGGASTVVPTEDAAPSGSAEYPSQAEATALVLKELTRRLAGEHVYPRAALRRGWEGEVVLLLRLNGRGESEELRVLRSSGRSLLDEAALKLVEGVLPVRNPLNESMLLEIPVSYRLN